MIASVHGRVAAVSAAGAVVEVGGVGLAVSCTPGTLARLRVGQPARLSTSLVVREDSLTLYGFSDDDERQVFELLQTASGVGPRLAQAALSVLPPAEVRVAIATADVAALTRVPGIGKKGAERLVLELRGQDRRDRGPGPVRHHPDRAPGGTRSGRPWSAWAGRRRRPTRRSARSPRTPPPRRTCRPCSGRRCGC